jgi:enterochelin esterase family protein
VRTPDDYPIAAEAESRGPNVPAGRLETFQFTDSKIFPDTTRDVWVYIPAQYSADKPAALMVFQDGHAYVSTNGRMRTPIVFDNLIARGDMPVTVGVFINPGHRGADAPPAAGWGNRNNRSLEYDGLGADYARFLADELLPAVVARYSLKLSADPAQRAIAGMSSGGICAFTAAWERPDLFGKVLSHIGSFVNIRGGHVYPALIRKTERKPIRVFLQDGANDLNNLHGDWPLSNQQLAGSLAFAGYDYRFVFGDGAHNDRHGAAILPDSLRWLWRPMTTPPSPSTNNWAGDEALNKVLPDGGKPGDWELVSGGHGFTDGACSDANGTLYFSDLPKAEVWKVPVGGKPERWIENGPKLSGLKFGPDGRIYAASQGGPGELKQRIVVINPLTREIETVATNVKPNDLVVTRDGHIYFTDTGAGQVVTVPITARNLSGPRPVAGGINAPNGIALSADEMFLSVSEYQGTNVWSFRLTESTARPSPPAASANATPPIRQLVGGERYSTLVVPADRKVSGGDGSTTDTDGRVYVTSHAGIQMFDRIGRLGGVISKPSTNTPVSCVFAGPDRAYLHVCDGPAVWRRRTLVHGK